tara:strand:- start:442 stop:1263 length:822 start_codon:yes stop_codon:yes gene_type:complete
MLLKGIAETETAARQSASAEMVIIRIAHAASLPSPEEAAKIIAKGEFSAAPNPGNGAGHNGNGASGGMASPGQPGGSMSHDPGSAPRMMAAGGGRDGGPVMHLAHSGEPEPQTVGRVEEQVDTVPVRSIEDMMALADKYRDIQAKIQLRTMVRLVRIEPGRVEINLTDDANPTLPGELIKKLADWTGRKWTVALSREPGQPTIAETENAKREALVSDARQDPDVAAILKQFPGAKITDVRIIADEEEFAPESVSESADGDILPRDDEGFDDPF